MLNPPELTMAQYERIYAETEREYNMANRGRSTKIYISWNRIFERKVELAKKGLMK